MKTTLIALALSALTSAAWSADYSVFRICEDQRVVRTSDGVDAGHVQYIVIEPTSHRIVSTIVSGGAVGERLVPVPIESVTFQGTNEVVLTQITRERLVSAPVIERAQLSSTTIIQPTIVERSFTHFGVRVNAEASAVNASRTDVNINARKGEARETTRGTVQTREQAERDALRSNRPDDPNAIARTRRDGDRNLNDRNERRDLSREPRSRDERNAEEHRRDGDSNRPGNSESVGQRNNDRSQSQRPPNAEKNAANSQSEPSQRASERSDRPQEKNGAQAEKKSGTNERATEQPPANAKEAKEKQAADQPAHRNGNGHRAQERSENKAEEQSAGERKAEHSNRPPETKREGSEKGQKKSDEKARPQ